MNSRKLGEDHEKLAAKWLEEKGYKIIEKNFRSKFGEIDLIAYRDRTIIFIEVKYRRSGTSGYGVEAVSMQKQIKISRTADYYRMKNNIWDSSAFRFDVITIDSGKLKHIENAFPYRGSF